MGETENETAPEQEEGTALSDDEAAAEGDRKMVDDAEPQTAEPPPSEPSQ